MTDLTLPRFPSFTMRASALFTALWLILPMRAMKYLRVIRSMRTSSPPRPPMHNTTAVFRLAQALHVPAQDLLEPSL